MKLRKQTPYRQKTLKASIHASFRIFMEQKKIMCNLLGFGQAMVKKN